MSSVATLGKTDNWLRNVFFAALAAHTSNSKTVARHSHNDTVKYSIIFPTADEIRRSLNGYASGGSIHMKLRTPAQHRQLQYVRPYLCKWAGDTPDAGSKRKRDTREGIHNAGRQRAAPHIKTYCRFSDSERMDSIDWAMMTSANLSTQAWGTGVNAHGEVSISSWEIGVVVWPDLFLEDNKKPMAKMVPCFQQDRPGSANEEKEAVLVGFRMPYNLPLTPYYGTQDMPWCASETHTTPDWLGKTWDGE